VRDRAAEDAKQARIKEHALVCPELWCQDDDDKRECAGFRAGSLYCETTDCPNPRHRGRP
jgi:hypothetical protein